MGVAKMRNGKQKTERKTERKNMIENKKLVLKLYMVPCFIHDIKWDRFAKYREVTKEAALDIDQKPRLIYSMFKPYTLLYRGKLQSAPVCEGFLINLG